MAHVHLLHRGPELVTAAARALTAGSEQWTPMREAVFEVLASESRPVSAYDIADTISRRQDRRIAPNSVYRILDLFVSKNLALRIESANAYVANPHPGCVHDCIFLVCNSCEQTTHVDDDELAESVRKSAANSDFAVQRAIIEVRGTCRDCGAGSRSS